MRHLKRNLRLFRQLCHALANAAIHRQSIPGLWKAFQLWSFGGAETAPFWIYFRRVRTCTRCEVFDPVARTCGNFTDKADLGCKCFIPAMSHYLDADCWLRRRGVEDEGWPDIVRPKESE